jgi:hypothetical protein
MEKNCGSVNIKLSHKIRGFNFDKKKNVYASTHLPADISGKFFCRIWFIVTANENVAVFQQSERFVLGYKLNQTAPDNGYCKGRERERERADIWLSDV